MIFAVILSCVNFSLMYSFVPSLSSSNVNPTGHQGWDGVWERESEKSVNHNTWVVGLPLTPLRLQNPLLPSLSRLMESLVSIIVFF